MPNQSVTVPPEYGHTNTVKSVIEIGCSDIPLFFDRAVRILFPGQARAEAGYYHGNTFIKITNNLHADSQEAGDAYSNGDGKISVGDDLVIWTKHFTRFVTYTQTPTNTGSTGGGGGGGPSKPVNSSDDTVDEDTKDKDTVAEDKVDKESFEKPETSEIELTDITGHWAEESIKNLVKMDVLGGYR